MDELDANPDITVSESPMGDIGDFEFATFGLDTYAQENNSDVEPLTDVASHVEASDTQPQEENKDETVKESDGAQEETALPAEAAPVEEKPEENAELPTPDTAPATEPEGQDAKEAVKYGFRQLADPTFPAQKLWDSIEKYSPSRANELADSAIAKRLENPLAFVQSVYDKSPEQYAAIIKTALQTSPEYFAAEFLGREGITREQLTEALEFHEKYHDKADQLAELSDDFDYAQLDTDAFRQTIEDLKEFDPEGAALIEKAISGARLTAQENAELKSKLAPEEVKTEENKDGTQPASVISPEQAETLSIWHNDDGKPSVHSLVENHLTHALDNTYKLVPTKAEQEATPVIAALKDLKRNILLYGDGQLPDFETGFGIWGRETEDVKEGLGKVLESTAQWSQRRERDNALESAKGLLPYADKYLETRLQFPVVKILDQIIEQEAAKLANNSTVKQDLQPTPGAPKIQNQLTADPHLNLIIGEAVKAASK